MPHLNLLFSFTAIILSTVACNQSGGDGKIDTVFDACQPLVIEPLEGSARERASVASGTRLWNDLVGSQLSVSDDNGTEEFEGPVIPLRFDEAGNNFHGFYDDVDAVIYVNDAMDDDRERSITVAHEIGHAFGLFHVDADESLSVMNVGNLITEPTRHDLGALKALWGSCKASS